MASPLRFHDTNGLFVAGSGAPFCLTEYLQNQVPALAEHPTIPRILSQMTGCDLSMVKRGFQWGSGPPVVPRNLPGGLSGLYDPFAGGERPNMGTIYLEGNRVQRLCECPCEAGVIGMGKTILHEFTHFLYRNCNGWKAEPTTMWKELELDLGYVFELEAYPEGDSFGYGIDEWHNGCDRE